MRMDMGHGMKDEDGVGHGREKGEGDVGGHGWADLRGNAGLWARVEIEGRNVDVCGACALAHVR